jgi:hypothetical protein
MNTLRFIEIVQSYGGASDKWPAAEREAAGAFAARHEDARALLAEARALDARLNLAIAPVPSADLRARIITRAEPCAPANDALPYRAIAATLLAGVFLGLMGGQFNQNVETAPENFSDLMASAEFSADYSWVDQATKGDNAPLREKR